MKWAGSALSDEEPRSLTILKYIQTKRIGSLAIALAFGVAGSIPVSA
jgi:hypothetical protein